MRFVFGEPQAKEWSPKDLWVRQNLLAMLYKLDLNDENPMFMGNVGSVSNTGAWSFGPTV